MNKIIINPCAILLRTVQSYHGIVACCKILTHLEHFMRLE